MILTKYKSEIIIPIPSPIQGCTIDYAANYNPLAQEDDGSCTYNNESENAIIVESTLENIANHGIYVQQEYVIGYPTGDSVIRGKGISDGLQYAANTQVGALIYSYGGLPGIINSAQNIYPTTQTFMPLGSNFNILITDPPTIPIIVTCGAGATQNDTAYGPGLEFWDTEVSGSPAINASLSNSRIAGKLMYIRNQLNCTHWEARYRARYTADRNLNTHPNGELWNQNNGFGQINASAAIALNAAFFCMDPDTCHTIPPDPYINGGNTYTPFIP